jgi:MFS family permease
MITKISTTFHFFLPFFPSKKQIPFGILAKRFGSLRFLGWGMMINSVFAFLVPVAAHKGGVVGLCVIRFIQGLGEGPIVSD